MRTPTPNSVVNSRGCLATATTAAQSLTRTTRHGWPSNRMTSPARRREELFMANFLWIEKRRLRCIGGKACFGEHLLIAFVGGVADTHAEFGLERGNGLRGDVGRPVVHVEPRAGIARTGGEPGQPRDEMAALHGALHVDRTLSESRISTPKTRVTSAEMALMTGLAPRRAIA